MKTALALLAALVATTCYAKTFELPLPSGLDLRQQIPTGAADADLILAEGRLYATHGIARAGWKTPFGSTAPVLLDENFLVRDGNGLLHTLKLERWEHGTARFTIDANLTVPKPATREVAAHLSLASWRIDGAVTTASFPDLVLYNDGTYKLGDASGHWSEEGKSVVLDGHFRAWDEGMAQGADLGKVTFSFQRGSHKFEVEFARQDVPSHGSLATRAGSSGQGGAVAVHMNVE